LIVIMPNPQGVGGSIHVGGSATLTLGSASLETMTDLSIVVFPPSGQNAGQDAGGVTVDGGGQLSTSGTLYLPGGMLAVTAGAHATLGGAVVQTMKGSGQGVLDIS
jgi:hypothetical protein